MEEEQIKSVFLEESEEKNIENKKKKFNKNKLFIIIGIFVLCIWGLYLYFLSLHLKGGNLYCEYKVMNMTDKIFIPDMNRKFIYELQEQTFEDWINFKRYVTSQNFKYNNWGSVILYCSEDKLQDEICKKLKKQYKK